MRVFGFEIRLQRVDPPQRVYTDLERLERIRRDSLHLMSHYFRGKAWSRRVLRGQMSQGRWNQAYMLLKLSGVLDEKGRVLAYDYDHAAGMVAVKVGEYRHRLNSRVFTLPF